MIDHIALHKFSVLFYKSHFLNFCCCCVARQRMDCASQNAADRNRGRRSRESSDRRNLVPAGLRSTRSRVEWWTRWRTSAGSSSKSSRTTRTGMSWELGWLESASDCNARGRSLPIFNSSLTSSAPRRTGKLQCLYLLTYSMLARLVSVRGYTLSICSLDIQPSHPGQLSLAIPPWVGAVPAKAGA